MLADTTDRFLGYFKFFREVFATNLSRFNKNLLMLFTYLCDLNELINKLLLFYVGTPSLRDRNVNVRMFTAQHTGTNNFEPNVRFQGVIMMMIIVMMMNCFCGMLDRGKTFSFISSWDHCQRSSLSRISDTPPAGFNPNQPGLF